MSSTDESKHFEMKNETNKRWENFVDTFKKKRSIIDNAIESIQTRRSKLEKERNHGNPNAIDSDVLDINAGGRIIKTTRGNLTQIGGTGLAELFGGKWDDKFCRDSQGRIFLDVNPKCFEILVDYLTELKLSPPDSKPSLLDVDMEHRSQLSQLCSFFKLDVEEISSQKASTTRNIGDCARNVTYSELGVVNLGEFPDSMEEALLAEREIDLSPFFPFQKALTSTTKNIGDCARSVTYSELRTLNFEEFPDSIKEALLAERESAISLANALARVEMDFETEQHFIAGEKKEIVSLNVKGTVMETFRSTLGQIGNSALSKQFDDNKWQEWNASVQKNRVKNWSEEDVATWANSIDGLSEDEARVFAKNNIKGVELLSMKEKHLEKLGFEHPGKLAIIESALEKLRDKQTATFCTFIDHDPYCFQKILDQLRMIAINDITSQRNTVPCPHVEKSKQMKFRKIVDYYFPGEERNLFYSDHIQGIKQVKKKPGSPYERPLSIDDNYNDSDDEYEVEVLSHQPVSSQASSRKTRFPQRAHLTVMEIPTVNNQNKRYCAL